MSKLIIVRGNSGSGKSTVARLLRDRIGDNTMLVPQDVVRREILFVKDRLNNPTVNLISNIVLYGKEIGFNVVLEGILSKEFYGDVLNNLLLQFGEDAYVFYMDVSFEETLKRHETKPNKFEFGPEKMKEWWIEKDYLSVPDEYKIPEDFSAEEAVDFIIQKLP